jgi:hypothetical protein
MQVFGARGCVGALPIERIWRDSRLARLGGGTDEVLADLVASGLDRQDPEAEAQLAGYLARDLPRPEPAGRAAGRRQHAAHLLDHTSRVVEEVARRD